MSIHFILFTIYRSGKCIWDVESFHPRNKIFKQPPKECGEYVMPHMPKDIAELKLGVDLPALAPPELVCFYHLISFTNVHPARSYYHF